MSLFFDRFRRLLRWRYLKEQEEREQDEGGQAHRQREKGERCQGGERKGDEVEGDGEDDGREEGLDRQGLVAKALQAVVGIAIIGVVVHYFSKTSRGTAQQVRSATFSFFKRLADMGKVSEVTVMGDAVFFRDQQRNRYVTGLFPGSENWLWQTFRDREGVTSTPRLSLSPQQGGSGGSQPSLLEALATSAALGGLTGLVYHWYERGYLGFLPGMKRGRGEAELSSKSRVRFADVAGHAQLKAELRQAVAFLKHPARFEALGARVPRGILMEGPSGTGKTLLARATAGEAGVPFFYATAASFVEVYVGQGAARVREFFANARSRAPCIVFLDELDALGVERRTLGHSSQEYVQTLNQLLSEMDGVERDLNGNGQHVIVIAATNRVDVLDEALLRPGRFDRIVSVGVPTLQDRMDLFHIHCKGKRVHPEVDLAALARRTEGFTGAEIEALLNDAALRAAREAAAAAEGLHVAGEGEAVSGGVDFPVGPSEDALSKFYPHSFDHLSSCAIRQRHVDAVLREALRRKRIVRQPQGFLGSPTTSAQTPRGGSEREGGEGGRQADGHARQRREWGERGGTDREREGDREDDRTAAATAFLLQWLAAAGQQQQQQQGGRDQVHQSSHGRPGSGSRRFLSPFGEGHQGECEERDRLDEAADEEPESQTEAGV